MFCLGLGRGTFLFGANHQLDAVFAKFAYKTHLGLQYIHVKYQILLHVVTCTCSCVKSCVVGQGGRVDAGRLPLPSKKERGACSRRVNSQSTYVVFTSSPIHCSTDLPSKLRNLQVLPAAFRPTRKLPWRRIQTSSRSRTFETGYRAGQPTLRTSSMPLSTWEGKSAAYHPCPFTMILRLHNDLLFFARLRTSSHPVALDATEADLCPSPAPTATASASPSPTSPRRAPAS